MHAWRLSGFSRLLTHRSERARKLRQLFSRNARSREGKIAVVVMTPMGRRWPRSRRQSVSASDPPGRVGNAAKLLRPQKGASGPHVGWRFRQSLHVCPRRARAQRRLVVELRMSEASAFHFVPCSVRWRATLHRILRVFASFIRCYAALDWNTRAAFGLRVFHRPYPRRRRSDGGP